VEREARGGELRAPEAVEEWRSGGVEEWRSGGVEEWRSGGVEEWRSGGVEEWRSGGVEEWRSVVFGTTGWLGVCEVNRW
jgi:hypothetical protein